MYPRNAASPQRIAIGAVVQISDGAVQTSGVSVKVMPQGGAASAGGGTIAYEEGIVHYLPTQPDTDHASFIVIAYKTGCIPVAQTIVTSASGTAGYAGLDWSVINAPTSTVNLSGTTVKTATDIAAVLPGVAAGSSGGLHINGSNAGTTTLAALTVTGALTVSGGVAITQSTVNGNGVSIAGNGTGYGLSVTGGATGGGGYVASGGSGGVGLTVIGENGGVTFDAVNGSALELIADSSTALYVEASGAASHGIHVVTTSGGLADGIKVERTGGSSGVDIRASITGNLTGNVSGSVGSVTAIATNAINAAALAADAVAEIADAVWDESQADHVAAGTFGVIASEIADVLVDTAEIGVAGAGLTALATQASVTTIDDLLDTEIADIRNRLPAALTGAGNMKVDVMAVDGDTDGALHLRRGVLGTVTGTVGAASSTTSIVTSSLDPAASVVDQFKGRIVTFDKDTTTAALRGQATDITASSNAGVLTVTALTTAPASGDTFVIT